jgi:FkbM family methyltransferase
MAFRKYRYYLVSLWKLLSEVRPLPLVARVFLRLAPPGRYLIALPRAGVRLWTRGVMDIWSAKETFLDRFYERFGIPVQDGWTIIDIGGGIGDYTIFAAKAFPRNRVFAFEPTPNSFALLQENLRLNGVQNVQAFQEAIWSQPGQLVMDAAVGEPGQFISRKVDRPRQNGEMVVPSVSLDQVFARLDMPSCDLMKMDCEGAEYPILFNASPESLRSIRRLVMEYHDNVSEYTHRDLAKFLADQGFSVKVQPNYVHSYLGYLYAERLDR